MERMFTLPYTWLAVYWVFTLGTHLIESLLAYSAGVIIDVPLPCVYGIHLLDLDVDCAHCTGWAWAVGLWICWIVNAAILNVM
jgi:hypothetical protein